MQTQTKLIKTIGGQECEIYAVSHSSNKKVRCMPFTLRMALLPLILTDFYAQQAVWTKRGKTI